MVFELVYRITFGAKGSMEVWLNGKSLGEVGEIDTLATEPTNWKVGSYRSSEAEGTTVIFQDGVTITKHFFSHPPEEHVVDEEPAEDVAAAAVKSAPSPPSANTPQAPAPTPDPLPCRLAKDELSKALGRLSATRHRSRASSTPAQRRRWTRQISRDEKGYRAAKRRKQRDCRGAARS